MKKSLMALALGASLAAAPAFAQFYVGGGIGEPTRDSDGTSSKLLGGYQFTPNWGVEGAYTDLGRIAGNDIRSWSAAGTGTLPLSQSWSLRGKLGVTSNRVSGTPNNTETLIGVGLNHSFTKNVGVGLEYEDFGKFSSVGNNNRVGNWSLNLKYTF